MKKRLIPLLVACVAAGPWANASPTYPPAELWTMNADGTAQQRLAQSYWDHAYGTFSWSPDSTRLVENGSEAGGRKLSIIDAASGAVLFVGPGWEPDWSSRDEIVFVDVTASSDEQALFVLDGDGENRRLLIDPLLNPSTPAWSPDGGQVAFMSGARLFVVNSDGTGLRQVTTVNSYGTPVWSPDEQRLAFGIFGGDLFVVNVDGTGERPVGDYEYSRDATWCPDGSLYFTVQTANGATAWIYSMDVGGNHELVTEGSAPSCSPSGTLAFSRDGDVHVMKPGEAGEPNLTVSDNSSDFGVVWSPDASKMAFQSRPGLPKLTPLPRSVSMRVGEHLVARGQLAPAPHEHGCPNVLEIQRIGEKGWRMVASARVNKRGRFRAELPDRPGLYRTLSRRHPSFFGTYDCLRAVSEIVRHRH